jgi:endonuclease/exonuclease/phosphatase family metal-dependent hydrolase
MRVMTWNLWWRLGPWEERAAAIASVVREVQPDVLLLQEVWSAEGDSAAHRLAAAVGLAHVEITDDPFAERRGEAGVGFHNAIASRWPLAQVRSHALPRLDGTPGHRRALSAVVDTPHGEWPVVSTHLDHRFDESAVRQLQAESLLHLVAEIRGDPDTTLPVVLGGDMNAVPDSDEIRVLTGRRAGPVRNLVLSDCWEQVGDGPGHTWSSDNPHQSVTAWPNRRLDYVFVSWPRPKPVGNPLRAFLAGTTAVEGVWPSDHAAVVVDLVNS